MKGAPAATAAAPLVIAQRNHHSPCLRCGGWVMGVGQPRVPLEHIMYESAWGGRGRWRHTHPCIRKGALKEHLRVILNDDWDATMDDGVEHARGPAIARECKAEDVLTQFVVVARRVGLYAHTRLP
eukprot:scaffold8551_cov132-Isochrysis_galbana.AAC.5